MPTLTAIDVLGVQRYIFASNRLRDAVACSYQVAWATRQDGGLSVGSESGLPDDSVLLAAGGTAILLFADADQARDYAAAYTRRLYDDVPGLEVVLVHHDYQDGGLAGALLDVQTKLLDAKSRRRPGTELLGLGVTLACRTTGLPAVGFDLDQRDRAPLAASLVKALARLDQANRRWEQFIPQDQDERQGDRYRFPLQMDHLGRTEGDTSFLGVVHIDGNGFG
ncbi:MAG: hypothetical protein KDD11_20885, partial [Acidobacteria bacterium]|nr:hypothetical protein [Acidobacteriota bacterium]